MKEMKGYNCFYIFNVEKRQYWNPAKHIYQDNPDYAHHYLSYGFARRSAGRLGIKYHIVQLMENDDLRMVVEKEKA